MLFNKKYDTDEVVTFKMANGDELIAKVLEDTDSQYVVSKPHVVVPTSQGISMIPAIFTADAERSIAIQKGHVMFHTPSTEKARNHYIQITTGIQPVTAGGIVTA